MVDFAGPIPYDMLIDATKSYSTYVPTYLGYINLDIFITSVVDML